MSYMKIENTKPGSLESGGLERHVAFRIAGRWCVVRFCARAQTHTHTHTHTHTERERERERETHTHARARPIFIPTQRILRASNGRMNDSLTQTAQVMWRTGGYFCSFNWTVSLPFLIVMYREDNLPVCHPRQMYRLHKNLHDKPIHCIL